MELFSDSTNQFNFIQYAIIIVFNLQKAIQSELLKVINSASINTKSYDQYQ